MRRYRFGGVTSVLVSVLLGGLLVRAESPETAVSEEVRQAFQEDARPVLERSCRPSHYPGGDQHEKAPFDDPATVIRLPLTGSEWVNSE